MVNSHRHSTNGFTLIELLIVIALMCILAALVIPSANPAIRDQLISTAQIVAGDLACARSLAVTNNDNYRMSFDLTQNSYTLENSTSKPLPQSLFDNPTGTLPTKYIVDFDELPHIGPTVRLYVAGTGDLNTVTPITQLEFGPLGSLTSGPDVYIWLTAGDGSVQRYVYLLVNTATGLTTVGDYGGTVPAVLGTH